ncbi:hypothetical protein [Nocardiopsis sp. L17-MgMaSL7]|uniref:hypothetical protein n=1 Tax=Nocardiopsis sp. L17-MgMaSL7 TaxID=1938893 RepID=UPI000D70C798|nr:hypothetical protein [Nocardiopsis sp. L17-MgMaSL7]PWV44564.1 hypothetical protein BDW27_12323 [Nocardiopsis sp. L17-MgMaSL7]
MPEQNPPPVVSAIHAVVERPGVHARPAADGGWTIEFTEQALVAFVSEQRAAAWQAAVAADTSPKEKADFGAGPHALEAVLALLRERGPMHSNAIHEVLAEHPGYSQYFIDEALKALSTRGEIAKTTQSRKSPWALT